MPPAPEPDRREPTPPSTATLEWVLARSGAERVTGVERLRGGWTSAMHAVRVDRDGEERELVLRRMFREPWKTHAAGLLEREAAILDLLAPTAIPVAGLVAHDPHARDTDEPALLMTRLPGRLRLDVDDRVVDALARMLVTIHRLAPAEAQRPRTYESWAVRERRRVPSWAVDAGVWERAFSWIDAAPPRHDGCFLHRDFHPCNVLFDGDAISGVVDWVETSWGPADLDVAHCSTNLALLAGPAAVARLRDAYRAAGGRLAGGAGERAYWELLDAVGFLPDPDKVAAPWRESGRPDLTTAVARARLEAYVAGILAQAG